MVLSVQDVWNIAHAAKLEKTVIKVGYAGGINFVFGKQMLQAAQDAADEINGAGGVLGSKIEIVLADTGLTAAGATSAIAKLVTSDKVDYLIGAYTSEEATAFQSEAARYKIVSLIHISTLRFDEGYQANPHANKYIFALSSSEISTTSKHVDALPFIVKTLKKELGLKKINVALISDNALWTVNIDKMMKEAFVQNRNDVNFVYQTKPARNATDFTTEITELMKKDVQLVIVFGGYGSVIPLTKQFNQMKVPALLMGSIILAESPDDFIKAVGPENAAYVIVGPRGTEMASARDAQLVKAFKAKHGMYPGHYATEGYNMIKILARGLEKAGTMNNDVLIQAIEKAVIPANQAWSGTVRLENHRLVLDYDLTKGVRKYLVQYTPQGDKTVVVFPEKGANSKIMLPPHMIKKWRKLGSTLCQSRLDSFKSVS
jgi:branched-chain amino acid transport system substrate-binding protein